LLELLDAVLRMRPKMELVMSVVGPQKLGEVQPAVLSPSPEVKVLGSGSF
jgi:hypothetical protein